MRSKAGRSQAIINDRKSSGELRSVDQLSEVPGFDGSMIDRLRGRVHV